LTVLHLVATVFFVLAMLGFGALGAHVLGSVVGAGASRDPRARAVLPDE
jgi:hypothetical protein